MKLVKFIKIRTRIVNLLRSQQQPSMKIMNVQEIFKLFRHTLYNSLKQVTSKANDMRKKLKNIDVWISLDAMIEEISNYRSLNSFKYTKAL